MTATRVFVSYSRDSQPHKDWVLSLSARLVKNGVDIVLDQWDLTLGGDLPYFMESGLTDADRVLAICTSPYVAKANRGQGGVGYEKMILTAQLMKDVAADRIIPVVRSVTEADAVPVFLSSKRYIDFRDEENFESRYAELLRDIHGEQINPRPALGPNPFTTSPPPQIDPRLSFIPERYVSPGLAGQVTFDYSNNNGRYVLGASDMTFETAWSLGGNSSIHAYNDPASIQGGYTIILARPSNARLRARLNSNVRPSERASVALVAVRAALARRELEQPQWSAALSVGRSAPIGVASNTAQV